MKLSSLKIGKGLSPGLLLGAALIVGLLPSTASATAVTGVANLNGNVQVCASCNTTGGIFFFNTVGTVNLFDGSPLTSTNSYAGLTGGTIQNLTGAPTTGPDPITDFMTFFVPTGNVFFDLQTIMPGVGTALACASNTLGNQCTPPNSPFTLTQLQGAVGIDLTLQGIAYTGSSTTGFSSTGGTFTAQVRIPGTITDVLAAVGNNTLPIQTYSATFSSAVPEPATFGLIGTALLGLGFLKRRRVRG